MDSACRLINSTILGLSPICPLETDHNIYLEEGLRARAAASGAAFIAMLLSAVLLSFLGRKFVTGTYVYVINLFTWIFYSLIDTLLVTLQL